MADMSMTGFSHVYVHKDVIIMWDNIIESPHNSSLRTGACNDSVPELNEHAMTSPYRKLFNLGIYLAGR